MEMETLRELLNLTGVKLMGGVRNPERNISGGVEITLMNCEVV